MNSDTHSHINTHTQSGIRWQQKQQNDNTVTKVLEYTQTHTYTEGQDGNKSNKMTAQSQKYMNIHTHTHTEGPSGNKSKNGNISLNDNTHCWTRHWQVTEC